MRTQKQIDLWSARLKSFCQFADFVRHSCRTGQADMRFRKQTARRSQKVAVGSALISVAVIYRYIQRARVGQVKPPVEINFSVRLNIIGIVRTFVF